MTKVNYEPVVEALVHHGQPREMAQWLDDCIFESVYYNTENGKDMKAIQDRIFYLRELRDSLLVAAKCEVV